MLDESRLKKIMGTVLKVDPAAIGDDASIETIRTWDSMRHMSLVLALEDEFGVAIPDDEAASITSYPLVLATMRRLLERTLSGATANGASAGSQLRDADDAPATEATAQPPAVALLPPLLSAFIARVRQDSPMHRGFLDQALAKLTRDEQGELDGYLAFCAARDLSIDYLAKCYLTVVADALREQLYFQRHGRYRYTSFADVARHVYFDREYMSYHLYGLALSSYLWPNHLELFRFFRETLPKDRRGRYLEIGPGHGYFFRNAIGLSRYDSFLGVDVSETSIRQTRDLVAHDATGRAADVRLECLDFLDATLPGGRLRRHRHGRGAGTRGAAGALPAQDRGARPRRLLHLRDDVHQRARDRSHLPVPRPRGSEDAVRFLRFPHPAGADLPACGEVGRRSASKTATRSTSATCWNPHGRRCGKAPHEHRAGARARRPWRGQRFAVTRRRSIRRAACSASSRRR